MIDAVEVALDALSSEVSHERLMEIIANNYECALLAAANPILSAQDLENLVSKVDDQLWSIHPDDRSEDLEEQQAIWMLCGVACNPNLPDQIKRKFLLHSNPAALIRFFEQMTDAEQAALPTFRDPVLRSFCGQEKAYEKLVIEAQSRLTEPGRLVEIFSMGLRELVDRSAFLGDFDYYQGFRERQIFTQFATDTEFRSEVLVEGRFINEEISKALETNPILMGLDEYFAATHNIPEFSFLGSLALANPNYPASPIDSLVRDSYFVCFWNDYLYWEHHPSLFYLLEMTDMGTSYEIDVHWWLALSGAIREIDTSEALDQLVEHFDSTDLIGFDESIDDFFDDFVSQILPFLVGSSQEFLKRSFEIDSHPIKQAILLNPSCTMDIRTRAMEINSSGTETKSLVIPHPVQLALYAAHLGKYDLIENWITTPEDIDSFIGFCDPYIVDAISELRLGSSESSAQDDRKTMLGTREKAEIIFEFINEEKMDGNFDDFFSYNDLGVPMAVMIVNDLIILTDEGLEVINETWKSLCEQFNDADPNYEYADLKDLVERNVPFEDPNDPEGIEG